MPFELTDEQLRVVGHRGSPLRVVAGPGTGKTMCLVARIVDLLSRDNADPRTMLTVTFTRAAAGEMRQRLEKEGIPADRMPDVRTLHSKAMGILRRHGHHLGFRPGVRPLSEHETAVVLEDVAADLAGLGIRLPFRGEGSVRALLHANRSELSGAGIPEWITRNKNLLETYRRMTEVYEALQGFYGSIDWFRVVRVALRLFEAHPDLLEAEQKTIEHLLVDEYQDLNHTDQELIRLLVGKPAGLCVVGDEDQSIYESQRFAKPNGLVDFHERNSGTTTLPLTVCHRCPARVIEKANALIKNNRIRIPGKADLQAAKDGGVVATFWRKSKKAETEWIVSKIQELRGRGAKYREIMILFGEGQIADDYIAALRAAQIPLDVQLKLVGPFDSVCFAQALSTLYFLSDQADNLSVRQCLGVWAGIGRETIKHLRGMAAARDQSLWEVIRAVGEDPDSYGAIRHRRVVRDFYLAMSELLRTSGFEKLVSVVVVNMPDCKEDPGVRIMNEYLSGQAGKEEVMTLGEALQNFEQERESGKFGGKDEELPDKVRILTLHSAKGLEAPIVFIPALEDDLMPGEMPNIEERRRLLYVSVTRSKHALLLSWASQRTGREIHRRGGKMLGKKKSRFLVEMGE